MEMVTTNNGKILNKGLQKATNLIFALGAQIKSKQYDVASILWEVEQKQLYSDDGFTNAAEYAMATFGFKKSKAYALVTIGKEYTRPVYDKKGKCVGHASNLVPAANPDMQDAPLNDFTVTQIERILPLGREKALELVNAGEMTPNMTVEAIRSVVKANKPAPAIEAPESLVEAPTTAPDNEPEQNPAPATNAPEAAPEAPTSAPEIPADISAHAEGTIGFIRGDAWDNVPSDMLIAELILRGFQVFRNGEEITVKWGE